MTAFLNGYNAAVAGALLSGFQEWLAAKLGFGRNLIWVALVLSSAFPQGRPAEPWSPEDDQHAVDQLFKLLDEYFGSLAGGPKADGEPQSS
ncbi:hypothetical protein [Streptomyces sp. YKOK-I1]